MTNDEIIQYYDYLIRLAMTKCNTQNDAEDLVGDTMLVAFAYLHKGGTSTTASVLSVRKKLYIWDS